MGIIDLTNQRFGRLTVQYPTEKRKNGCVVWHCVCDCGNEIEVSSNNLRKRAVRSCGCYFKEQSSLIHKKSIPIGTVINELTVLEELSERTKAGAILYKCECSCGNTTIIEGRELRRGRIQTCGHLVSKGEKEILEFLQDYDIKYKYQYREHNLYYNSGHKPIFDFAFFNEKDELLFFLEYNGIQHYKSQNSGWNTEEHFLLTQKRDDEKQELCMNNNIPLEIISYKEQINLKSILENLISKYY